MSGDDDVGDDMDDDMDNDMDMGYLLVDWHQDAVTRLPGS